MSYRKTKLLISALAFSLVFLLGCLGETPAQAAGSHSFELGPEVSYINYEEPDVVEEKGIMYGIHGAYTYRMRHIERMSAMGRVERDYSESGGVLRVEGKFAYGQVDYDSNGTGSIDNIDDYLGEARGLVGYDLPMFDASRWTPYFGFGFRYLSDNLGGKTSTTGHLGYDRESHYLYVPLGLETKTAMNENWSVGLTFEYDFFIKGKQKSHLEDVNASLSTLETDQDSGWGARGSLKLAREHENWDFIIEPFVRYWDIDESNVGTINCAGVPCAAGVEPKNTSWEYGLKLGARF
jgi:hypothetical protein